MTRMRQDTPYTDRPEREKRLKVDCMKRVLRRAAEPSVVFDALAGIGVIANVILSKWPDARIESVESDEGCVALYKERVSVRGHIILGDARSNIPSNFDAASLDFNQFTLLDLDRKAGAFQRELLEATLHPGVKWVQLTDSSISKLHLNWETYGLADDRWETYVRALNERLRLDYGWRVSTRTHHGRASFFRLEPVS